MQLHSKVIALLLAVLLFPGGIVLAATQQAVPKNTFTLIENLKPVGTATLKVLFWEIYESSLYTPTGEFEQVAPETALRIVYKRNIASEQLVKTTRSEWERLALYEPEVSDLWLAQLSELWPDIKSTDELLVFVDCDLNSHFYFNQSLLGSVNDADFTRRFLAIWLSPDSRHPRARAKLLNIDS